MMKELICPFMSGPVTHDLYICTCKRERCMAWNEDARLCKLIDTYFHP
jgi:hypothetical protein